MAISISLCLDREHNVHNKCPWHGLKPGPLNPESRLLTMRQLCLYSSADVDLIIFLYLTYSVYILRPGGLSFEN